MVHLFILANVLIRIRYKIRRLVLSFCVFTTMSHVSSSMCNLLNYLANDSTILWTRCALQILQVHEALFGTRLTQTEKRKNNDTPAHVISWTRIGGLSAIRYGDPPHPKKQPHSRLPHISAKPKRFDTCVANTKRSGSCNANKYQQSFFI